MILGNQLSERLTSHLWKVAPTFLKGYCRPLGAESVPEPQVNKAVVFEDFFDAGLRMQCNYEKTCICAI
jgi:hypothetical protein